MDEIVIVAGKRSPIGNLGGALAPLQAHEIGAQVIAQTLEQCGVEGAQVDETIMGQVLSAGAGMNPARQAARAAKIDDAAPAMSINQVCGSGLRAVALAAQQIQTQNAKIVVAGGQESMSNAPHVATLRQGKKLGNIELVDTVMRDGLSDAFYGYPMGNTAENIARQDSISRKKQDEFALRSQQKASIADKDNRFTDEIVPIEILTRKGLVIFERDEFIRHDADLAGLEKLRPVFDKGGTVTAGNASGINDGAAAVVLMSASEATVRKICPLATIRSFGQV
ncbi:MAG: acetyl-CoA C-acyltransferase, partial [Devosiaceae bacterium]|nr:acetyl-CoA C-acyltransferase [Devosiaceae bacterium]